MKRFGDLYERIISIENLQLADEKARKGKKDTYGVKLHDRNREDNIKRLHEVLERCEYHTSEYSVFTIREPKEREIYRLPYYPDRIMHHAIMNVLEPIWLGTMTADTCSCIRDRGIHYAMERMKSYMKDVEGTRYCLKTDIHKFYPSIDHDIMKFIVRKKIKDARLLKLLDEIIDSAQGLPIGNYLSQYLSNLYLAYIDHRVKETYKVRYYVRYADDMVFFAKTKAELSSVLEMLRKDLVEIKLELKGNEQIFPVAHNKADRHGRGVDFVGYVFYHEHTMMRKSIKKSFARKAASLHKNGVTGKVKKMQLASWTGWAKWCDSKNLLNKLKT